MIYLDNAATTFPKPDCVHEAADRFARTAAVNAGKVVGECLHCNRELSAEYINRHKDGWRYRWRSDQHK